MGGRTKVKTQPNQDRQGMFFFLNAKTETKGGRAWRAHRFFLLALAGGISRPRDLSSHRKTRERGGELGFTRFKRFFYVGFYVGQNA